MGKHSKANAKNVFRDKQVLTTTEGVLPDGRLYFVPDAGNAYGDEVSNSHLAEDFVGKHAGNKAALVAGEKARQDFNTETRKKLAAIESARYFAKHPAGAFFLHTDNTGKPTGVTVRLAMFNRDTERTEVVERFVPAEDVIFEAMRRGRLAEVI